MSLSIVGKKDQIENSSLLSIQMVSNASLGIVLALLYSIIVAFRDSAVKEMVSHLPASEIVFFSNFFALILVLIDMRRQKVSIRTANMVLPCARGFFSAVEVFGFYYILGKITLPEATILRQTFPLFVILLSVVLMGVPFNRRVGLLTLMALFGSTLIIKPFGVGFNVYTLLGLGVALSRALSAVCIRMATKNSHHLIVVMYFFLISIIISLPFCIAQFVQPTMMEMMGMCVLAGLLLLTQKMITRAYHMAKVEIISKVQAYSAVLINAVIGYVFWHERMDILSVIGSVLILFSITLVYKVNQTGK